jgi:hypothetical protein
LECLEDRMLPTILYNPVFGPETTSQDGSEHMQQPQVYLIFWGSYWSYGLGPSQASLVTSAASQVVTSTFPLITNQYGADGSNMSIAGTVFDYSNPSNGNFGAGDINDVVQNQIDNGPLPESDAFNGNDHSKIYVVVTPPNVVSSIPNGAGFNHVDTDTDFHGSVDVDDIGECWVWSGSNPTNSTDPTNPANTVNLDQFSLTFSHEVAEIMSDFDGEGYKVNPPPGAPPGSGNQIGDYEGNGYAFRLSNGVDVQPLWSRADNAWAVDDGTSQTFYLDATGNWAGNQFSQFNQTYALTLNGDQNGSPTDDTVTIGQVGIGVQKGGVQVTQNGETVTFDKGQITNITINMKDGNDTINVENAISGVPVTINLGSGNDVVNISPSAGNLNTIQANVTVNAGSGFDTLNVDDQNNFNDATWTMNAGNMTRTNGGTIFYNGLINSLNVNGGRGNVTYNVNGTQPAFPTTVNTGTNSSAKVFIESTTGPFTANLGSGVEAVFISPFARNLDNISGNVTINGLFGVNQTPLNTLVVADQNNGNSSNWEIEGSSVLRIAGSKSALINYKNMGDLEVRGGFGGSSFNVTPIGQNLDFLPNTFNITGGKSSDSLTLNDQANSLFASWSITGSNVTRTSTVVFPLLLPLTDIVNYSHIGNLTVNGGSGGSEFDLSPTAMNLDELPANVTLNGGGNFNSDSTVLDDQNNPIFSTWNVTGSSVDRSYTLFVLFQNIIIPVPVTTAIHYSHLSNLVLNGGSGGNEFDLSPFAQNLDELPATVTVNGGGSANTLNVFDQSNSNSSTWNVSGTSLDRTWLAGSFIHILPITRTIDYSALTSLAVHGGNTLGSAGNIFNITGTPASTSVDSGIGTDQVNVQASANPLSINGDSGTDTVILGSKAPSLSGTLSNIAGPVSVSNHSTAGGNLATGQTTLVVDDSGDGSPRTPTLTSSSLSGLGPMINYTAGEVTNLQVLGGKGGNTFNVNSTAVTTNLIGNAATTINVGNGGSMQGILGTLNIEDPTGHTTINADDSADGTARIVTLGTLGSNPVDSEGNSGPWGQITGLAPANINYEYADTASLTVSTGNVAGHTPNTVYVQSLGKLFAAIAVGTGDTVTIGQNGSMAGIMGDVRIQSLVGQAPKQVTLDDSADNTAHTVTFGSDSTFGYLVNGLANSSQGLGRVGLQLDPATPVSIRTGAGNDAFRIHDLTNVPALALDAGGGTNRLDYSNYKGTVQVVLPLGVATGFAGGIKNIANVIGSQGNNLLVGDANPNVLIGGTARNVIIGGAGADTLDASAAASDNILIGGTTDFDTNLAALDAIFAEWTRTDLGSHDRFSDLSNGTNGQGATPLNTVNGQLILLTNQTVHADSSPDTLTGTNQTDPATGKRAHNWFFYDADDTFVNFLSSSDHKTKVK